jgi:flagellar hook assembly protein FlgD
LTRPAVAVFLALVAATFGAFFAAQRLKGAAPIVELVGAKRPFSPNGDGVRDVKRFAIAVRTADELTVDVVDTSGNEVRRLADDLRVRPNRPRNVRWDGRADDGRIAPDGFYQLRVTLRRTGRSVIVPAKLRIDTRPPRPYVRDVRPGPNVAPGTSGITVEVARISRKTPAEMTVWRTDGAEPVQVAHGEVPAGLHRWVWDGKAGGRPAPPGTYLFQVAVRDSAGNLGRTPPTVRLGGRIVHGRPGLTVRGLAAQAPVGPVTAGTKVTVEINSLHRPYSWQLRRVGRARAAARGRQASPQLTFKAPAGPSGLYLLQLQSATSAIRVPILVQATKRAKVLVVVPMLTWVGGAPVDDNGDGLPDTLEHGSAVRWPRVLPGLPAGLAGDVAPLLVFLDRAGVAYDLTSDLALTLDGRGPRATDRTGVLLAGAQRWAAPAFAQRLRRFVVDGGRLVTIATDSLRRGVTVVSRDGGADGRFVRPTQAVDRDPFGARLRKPRSLPTGTELRPIAGSANAPLLAFWDGTLSGFTTAEESEPPLPSDNVKLLAAVGVEPVPGDSADALPPPPRPALTEVQLGKGIVIRIGLPGWTQRLAKDPAVAQLTRNAFDLLVGGTPKPRSLR